MNYSEGRSKSELRAYIREAEAGREAKNKTANISDYAEDAVIGRHFLSLPEYKNAETVMLYCSKGHEVPTGGIILSALGSGKRVCLPYSFPGGIMSAKLITDAEQLAESRFGIAAPPEYAADISPLEIDLILVPGLAFDITGGRLGHGGGYYDRYLKLTRAYPAGISREAFIFDKLPKNEYDMGVSCIITETGIRYSI